MTTKHTPGPWYRDRNSYVASEVGTVARAYAGGRAATTKEGRLVEAANAALIAAAPELLDALQREQEWRDREAAGELDDGWDYETMVGQYRRAAIAKAEGRTE